MSLLEDMSSALGIASLVAKGGGGGSGFASTGVAEDTSTGKRYFYKKVRVCEERSDELKWRVYWNIDLHGRYFRA